MEISTVGSSEMGIQMEKGVGLRQMEINTWGSSKTENTTEEGIRFQVQLLQLECGKRAS